MDTLVGLKQGSSYVGSLYCHQHFETLNLPKKFIERQIHNKGNSMHDVGYRERESSHRDDDDDDDGCAVYLHLCCATKKIEVVS